MSPSPRAPRWYTALEQAVTQNKDSSLFQLATVDEAGKPHVRSHIHRAFLVPPSNPALPLLVTSTDIRTPKIQQISHRPSTDSVELAWWIDATLDQFRISGRARVFAAPGHSTTLSAAAPPPPPPPPPATAGDFAGIKALEASGFEWEAKRRELFDAVNGKMRATWCRPVAPGDPLHGGYEEMGDWPIEVPKPSEAQTEKEKELAELALSNYALIVIEPLNVDWLQMAIKPNRRTLFTREGEGVDWKEVIVAP